MDEDHLDREVSLEASMTENGIKGSARSRAVSGFDRFLGNAFELINAPLENIISDRRSRTKARISLRTTAVETLTEKLKGDPHFALLALEGDIANLAQRRTRKIGVLQAAFEDLTARPPTEEQSSLASDTLDERFLSKIERYAEEASSSEMQERWGKVLASEIREPGTFDVKALRVIDELDTKTAHIFNDVCRNRLGDALFTVFPGHLSSFDARITLVDAGLLVSRDTIVRRFHQRVFTDGETRWYQQLGQWGLAVPAAADLLSAAKSSEGRYFLGLTTETREPGFDAYALTSAGQAIANLIEAEELETIKALGSRLSRVVPGHEVMILRKADEGLAVLETIPAASI